MARLSELYGRLLDALVVAAQGLEFVAGLWGIEPRVAEGRANDLIGWLADVSNRDGWQPDGLVLLGSGDELDVIAGQLEQVLGIPVFAPAEAELALARGAALASKMWRCAGL